MSADYVGIGTMLGAVFISMLISGVLSCDVVFVDCVSSVI